MTLDINTATSDQLKQWRDGQNWDDAPQGAKDQLDAIIAQRYTDESVAAAMGNYRRKEIGRKNDEKALRDWPELKDENSPMYHAVTAEMESDPNALEDPNAFANAARKVGLGMGLTPAGFTPAKSGGGDMDTIGGGDGVAGREGVEPGVEFLEATKDIAKTFGGMLDMNDPKVRAEIAARVEGDK
jgi:hypothetical protein